MPRRLDTVISDSLWEALHARSAATGRSIRDLVQQALSEGLDRMKAHGGARPGDRTMIDALAPALAALPKGLAAAAAAARAGADATARLRKARAGRSNYVAARHLAGVPDPGAEAVALLLEGLAETDAGH